MVLAGELAFLGKCEQSKNYVKQALDLLRGQMSIANAAIIYAACNDLNQAQSLFNEARTLYPKNTVVSGVISVVVTSITESKKGNISQATQLLESVRAMERGHILGLSTMYARGNLYLQQRMGKEAAAEFQAIIDLPGVEMFSPVHRSLMLDSRELP